MGSTCSMYEKKLTPYRVLVRLLGKPRHRRKNNINMGLRNHWRALANINKP
jgi:hypothetical protein